MNAASHTNPTLDELRVLSRAEAAELLGLSVPLLERHAAAGTGPAFVRLSARRLGYRVADLRAWLAERTENGATRAA